MYGDENLKTKWYHMGVEMHTNSVSSNEHHDSDSDSVTDSESNGTTRELGRRTRSRTVLGCRKRGIDMRSSWKGESDLSSAGSSTTSEVSTTDSVTVSDSDPVLPRVAPTTFASLLTKEYWATKLLSTAPHFRFVWRPVIGSYSYFFVRLYRNQDGNGGTQSQTQTVPRELLWVPGTDGLFGRSEWFRDFLRPTGRLTEDEARKPMKIGPGLGFDLPVAGEMDMMMDQHLRFLAETGTQAAAGP